LSALRKMMHLNRQILLRMTAVDQGGRPGRAGVLRVLSKNAGVSQRELAGCLHVSPPTVTAMLQKMEQDGLVERWNDGDDQRVTRIRLTTEGRRLSDGLSADYGRYVGSTIGSMTEADRVELARLLGILADNTAAALKQLDEPAG
jgi:DNA-binding MarR family transcriptional regulator